jgi:hypothetical protein
MDLYQLPINAKAGSIYLSKSLDTTKDIVVTFECACYGSAASGSEGFSLFFYNSFAKYLSGGGPGPGLGYTPVYGISGAVDGETKSIFDGVFLGHLGIGFDLTGNYGTSGFGLDGLSGTGIPNSITIRGSQNNQYTRLLTTNNLSLTSNKNPLSFYQSVTSVKDVQYSVYKVRITDFCKKLTIDCKPPGASDFINYVTTSLQETWPVSVTCCLGFTTGLIDTCFAVKNFSVNGIFTNLSAIYTPDTNFWIYCSEWYLNQIPMPQTFTAFDTISAINAAPWDNYPPLILVSPEGAAPLQNTDNYINITYMGNDICNVVYPGDDYIDRVSTMSFSAQDTFREFVTQLIAADNIWSKIIEGWLLAKDYNAGTGTTVYALKNSTNNGTIVYNQNGTGITWENTGIRFYSNTNPITQDKVPRIQITNWTRPNLQAPMGLAVITRPLTGGGLVAPGRPRAIFGRTSWGGGAGQHFGFNFNADPNRLDLYHGNNAIAGGLSWTGTSFLSSWWLEGMFTDGKTISAFLNGYYATPANWNGSYNYMPGTTIDNIYFGNSLSGFTAAEYDGIIQAGFVFSEPVDLNRFYQIYKATIGKDITFPSYP